MSAEAGPPAAVTVESLDHLVITVRDPEATLGFYVRVLGMERLVFGEGRLALRFGSQKLNVHPADAVIEPRARVPTPGSADLCFLTTTPADAVIEHLRACGVAVEAGPVMKTGATGPIRSVYFRDPDGNLVEVSNPA
jgi:catechol 2,3-dioxygenase-like lactoylglutathione lyase family enzyme